MIDDPEKDAFNHIEMMSRVKQENVRAQMQAKTQQVRKEYETMNNPQAFPNPHLRDDSGITMRDYFAARAMQGTLFHIEKILKQDEMQGLANMSYCMADAMMKARET